MTAGSEASVRDRRGFTLIELMIVVMIIGTLATLVVPNYRRSLLKARSADVVTRIEAITVAMHNYEADGNEIPSGEGPSGSPPAWMAPHLTGNHFSGPGNIAFQFTGPDGSDPPTLVIAAGDEVDQQVLVSAAAALGPKANLVGGGASVVVRMSN